MILNSKTFSKQLSRSTDRFNSRLKAFIASQNVKNVHDIRTLIRRIEVSFSLLPKNIRKKQTIAYYLTRSKSLFKLTSTIRDIDIVEGKIKKFQTFPGIPDILSRNAEKRKRLLSAALKSARALERTPSQRIKASQISESKLARRRKKIERRFEDYLDGKAATMLSNPSPEQIHDFRKNCKMLRYAIEIDSSKKKEKLETILEDIQTILGSVMDDYTTLRYLSEPFLGDAGAPLVNELNTAKAREYNRFVRILKKEFDKKIANAS